jgi:hypothetical protein
VLYATHSIAAEPEWKLRPLRIPDREAARWDDTHPLEQLQWAREKNARCNKHFLNVVKALKWWRRLNPDPKHPKGYPVEHIIGDCCPDGIRSVAEGVTRTLEQIVERYEVDVLLGRTPVAPDRGVPGHNVLRRVSPSDFKAFYGVWRRQLESPALHWTLQPQKKVLKDGSNSGLLSQTRREMEMALVTLGLREGAFQIGPRRP